MSLCLPMASPVPEQKCLGSSNLADEPLSANGPSPCYQSRNALNTNTQNLADEPTLADGHLQYQSRDDLHTTTQNLADKPTLADGPPSTRTEMTCIPLHKTWQMNLLWLMDPSTRAEMTCIPLHKT